MLRRQFLSPEPTTHPHSPICEPESQKATEKFSPSHRAVGDNQAAHHQHQCVITRPDPVQFIQLSENAVSKLRARVKRLYQRM